MPPNLKEPPAAAASNVERMFTVTNIWLAMINLFKVCVSTKRFWPGGTVSMAHLSRNEQPGSMNACWIRSLHYRDILITLTCKLPATVWLNIHAITSTAHVYEVRPRKAPTGFAEIVSDVAD